MLAMTDADFPRVLNGPAPGYAEDALRRLLLGNLPAGAARAGSRRGDLETAPAGAKEEAGRSVDCRIGEESGGVGGAAKLESTAPLARPAGLEGHVGAALSEVFSWESCTLKEEDQVISCSVVVLTVVVFAILTISVCDQKYSMPRAFGTSKVGVAGCSSFVLQGR